MQQEQSSSFITCCSSFAMFAAFCSAGERTCTCKSTGFTSLLF